MNPASRLCAVPLCVAGLIAGCGGGSDDSGVAVRYSETAMESTLFPSDRFTTPDAAQYTQRRVALPTPDCTVRVSDCVDLSLINTLDGFNTQPRISIPFTGEIDPTTLTSETIFLVHLGDARTQEGRGERVGINQIMWDPASTTAFVESDELLDEHSRYLLVVTDGVRDAKGRPLSRGDWLNPATDLPTGKDSGPYAAELAEALSAAPAGAHVVAASVFTTRSVSHELQRIQAAAQSAASPAPIDFMVGTQSGEVVRAVFSRSALTRVEFKRQTGVAPVFTPTELPLSQLDLRGPVIETVAYGRFSAPHYLNENYFIPTVPSASAVPEPQGTSELTVQVMLPAGAKPEAGWPVMIYGHGFGDSMFGSPWRVASSMAAQGIATIAINVMGHAGGPLGTVEATLESGERVTIPAGGRSADLDGDGTFAGTEGASAKAPYGSMVGSRDGMRQTVADLFHLVRQIQMGIDVDTDGSLDLDANRIYFSGQSLGGIYGGTFVAVEPAVKASVINVAGGSLLETTRLGGYRAFSRASDLDARTPSLINLPPLEGLAYPNNLQFEESMPLRNLPVLVNQAPGATDIAQVFDRAEWVGQSGNIVSFTPLMRKRPLEGVPVRPVIFQVGKGDQQAPNPTSTAMLRAGDLADRATYYRHDLAYAEDPRLPKDSHGFLTAVASANTLPIALAGQDQIATFFASEGTVEIDPDGAGPLFEMPAGLPLPETLNYIR